MKHAGTSALDDLEPLLAQLRCLTGMVEKKRGVFYRRSQAFLHFHEDPKGLFADLRAQEGTDFERFDVTAPDGRERLLAATASRLKA
ncbi:MAG: hypothetical protein C0481_21120 [Phenylobacterium sp.]|uniref:hypothetical protein n=1 Tax=Phenylobacterium sp. TaxID=1871053 RepID=UPI0025CF7B8C|nr:hypothetical protein [Phenylobacterium sp.]MBA4014367.1 hypothetical protein [Phenylobacterium sp.]